MQPPKETHRKHGTTRNGTETKDTGTTKHQKERYSSYKSRQTHQAKLIKSKSDKDPDKESIPTLTTKRLPQKKERFNCLVTGLQPRRQ